MKHNAMKHIDAEAFRPSPAGAPPPPPEVAVQRTEPFGYRQRTARRTRRTVDLSPEQHRALDIWQREAADRLGRARVTGQDVMSALVDQLLSDPRLANQIIRAIQARR